MIQQVLQAGSAPGCWLKRAWQQHTMRCDWNQTSGLPCPPPASIVVCVCKCVRSHEMQDSRPGGKRRGIEMQFTLFWTHHYLCAHLTSGAAAISSRSPHPPAFFAGAGHWRLSTDHSHRLKKKLTLFVVLVSLRIWACEEQEIAYKSNSASIYDGCN